MTRRVAIIGCGSAGPATAILLSERGFEVTLFEQAEQIQPVGAGLLLQPAGQHVLAELGIYEPVAKSSAHIRQLLGHNTRGRLVLDLRYEGLAEGMVGFGVHRALLVHVLLERLKETGAELRCGVRVEALEPEGERWVLRLRGDGGEGRGGGGERLGPYDLVVLADGARSELRDDTGLVRRAEEYPWGALWSIVPDREQVYPHVLRQFYESTTQFLGFLPTGTCLTTGEPLVSVFWSVRNDQAEALKREGWEKLLARMLELAPEAAPILEGIGGWEDWIHARYMDVELRRPYGPGVVCVGDTAHAMSPQLGQGVTMALLDASALARSLSDRDSIVAGLALYARRRKSATRFYQFANRAATWFFQHDLRAFGSLRDLLFGPLNYLPLYRGQMLRTLAGLKTGFLTSAPITPPSHRLSRGPSAPRGPDV